jgi:5-methyltetrahydropteroyltriglutamate--homocysteine methyltransferase
MVRARANGEPVDEDQLARGVAQAVKDVVRRQVEIGIDQVNDGEQGKTSFNDYVGQRLGGLEKTTEVYVSAISGRDQRDFPEYYARNRLGGGRLVHACVDALTYVGHEDIQTDIRNLKAALDGLSVERAYLPAVAPGTMEHWVRNAFYPDEEAFLYAIADALHEEYRAITDAGLILQIDDPDLADGWQVHPDLSLEEYLRMARLRVEALNHALRDLPQERVVLHMCWGSAKGPHTADLPLRDLIDLILSVNAGAYSLEAANPRHEHEWQLWRDVKLPEGKVLIPGVAGHYTEHVEHPELIAQRLVRYAELVGRENVMAGTDCGLGSRLSDPKICWAKLDAMVKGARLATQQLWGSVPD